MSENRVIVLPQVNESLVIYVGEMFQFDGNPAVYMLIRVKDSVYVLNLGVGKTWAQQPKGNKDWYSTKELKDIYNTSGDVQRVYRVEISSGRKVG